MTDSAKLIHESESSRLADMMFTETDSPQLWQPEELGDILRHEMSAAVEFELGGLNGAMAERLRRLTSARRLLVKSFGDLLGHPNPPVELLEMVKEYAKALSRHPASPLPREIAMALYYAAIVVAHLRCGKRISKLKDQEIRAGLERIAARPWMTGDLRKLFEEGLDRFRRDAEERKDHGPKQAS